MDSYYELLDSLLKDACLVSFNLNRTVKYRSLPDELSVYASIKTLANFVIDYPRIITSYVPYMKWTPNPYGAIIVFPAHNVLKETLTFKKITPLLSTLVRPPGWALGKNNIKTLGISYDSLLKYCRIQELQLADDLMKLYSKFTLDELNVLATNRTENNTLSCVKYNLGMWRNNFQKFLDGLKKSIDIRDSVILQNALKDLRLAAKAAKLIPEKIKNFHRRNPIIKAKLLQFSSDMPIGYDLSKAMECDGSEDFDLISKDGSKAIVLCNLALLTFSLMGETEDLRKDKTKKIPDYFDRLIQLSGLSEPNLKIDNYCKAIEKKNLNVIWERLNFYFRALKEKSKHD